MKEVAKAANSVSVDLPKQKIDTMKEVVGRPMGLDLTTDGRAGMMPLPKSPLVSLIQQRKA